MSELLEFFKITGPLAAMLLGAWAVLNVVGELFDKAGKALPAFMQMRKYLRKRKEARKKRDEISQQVESLLVKVNEELEKVEEDKAWREWVNDRAQIYDASVEDLKSLHKALEENNALTLDVYINMNRNRILDFASKVANDDMIISREEFARIFKVNKEYHDVLTTHNKTNGEVDIAFQVIVEGYEDRLHNHSFLEDVRGYSK